MLNCMCKVCLAVNFPERSFHNSQHSRKQILGPLIDIQFGDAVHLKKQADQHNLPLHACICRSFSLSRAPFVDADITTLMYSQISSNKNIKPFHADLDQHKGSGYQSINHESDLPEENFCRVQIVFTYKYPVILVLISPVTDSNEHNRAVW